jgi:uncharacterized LabA/DUF88 family protein
MSDPSYISHHRAGWLTKGGHWRGAKLVALHAHPTSVGGPVTACCPSQPPNCFHKSNCWRPQWYDGSTMDKGAMNIYPTERIALFIDGANLYATAKALGFDIDYKNLLGVFRSKGHLVRALYYTALIEDQEYSSLRPLVDWLDYNGFTMVTKPTKEFTDASGRRKIKGNMDIELTVDAMELAAQLDHVVLFSGDGDFRSLVAALQAKGLRVSVVSTLQTQPPMIADELRRQADQFIDIADLQKGIRRDPS